MTSEEFVRALKLTCSDTDDKEALRHLLEPPGRRPSARSLRISGLAHRLSSEDREMLIEVVNDAAEGAAFGFLCVLDGVRAIENGQLKGRLELHYVNGDRRVLLSDPDWEELHNLYQGMRNLD